jgi:hypothetical protein
MGSYSTNYEKYLSDKKARVGPMDFVTIPTKDRSLPQLSLLDRDRTNA